MYATTAVSIRSTSSAEGEKLGDLSFAQEVHVIGRDKNTGWYRIEHEGGSAWVSDSYLSDSKPTVRTPSNNQQSASAGKSKAARQTVTVQQIVIVTWFGLRLCNRLSG